MGENYIDHDGVWLNSSQIPYLDNRKSNHAHSIDFTRLNVVKQPGVGKTTLIKEILKIELLKV